MQREREKKIFQVENGNSYLDLDYFIPWKAIPLLNFVRFFFWKTQQQT